MFSLILTFVICISIFIFAVFFLFKGYTSDAVTIAEMKRCEKKIKKDYLNYISNNSGFRISGKNINALDFDKVVDDLNLQLQKIDNSSNMSTAIIAQLIESNDPNYYGAIQYTENKDFKYVEKFNIAHEISHYLIDVGKGQKVKVKFTKPRHGYINKTYKEQVIDYYAAALTIPKDDLINRISNGVFNNPFDDNFIQELIDIYQQPKETIKRRIKEVLVLTKI